MVYFPVRVQIALMIFVGIFISYVLRSDISIYMLDMVEFKKVGNATEVPYCVTLHERNQTINIDTRPKGPPFGKLKTLDWEKDKQSRIRTSYFYGYMIMNLLGGPLSERYGARIVLICTFVGSTIVSFCFPFAVYIHWTCAFASRLIIGIAAGMVFPAMQTLLSHWAPSKERSKLATSLLGGNLGTVISMPILGFTCTRTNWIVAVFVSSTISLLGTILIIIIVQDDPESHKFISQREIDYIRQELGPPKPKTKKLPPYLQMFINLPFWGFVSIQIGSMFGVYLLMTSQPAYLKEVMGIDKQKNSFISASPHLARIVFGSIFSVIGDYARKKLSVSITLQRKFFVIFSHIIPGALMLIESFNVCSILKSTVCCTLVLGFNGAVSVTTMVNAIELTPNYAGTVFGIGNFFASASGSIIGEMVGRMTKGQTGYVLLTRWQWIFTIGSIVYMSTGFIFLLIGSAMKQDFNDYVKPSAEDTTATTTTVT